MDVRDKIYDTADAACRSAAAAWTSIYDLAVQSNDKNLWVVEDAVWTAYVQSCGVRNVALEHQQEQLSGMRQRGRDEALSRMLGGGVPAAPAAAAPPAPEATAATPAAAPVPVAAAPDDLHQTAHIAPAAPAAAPPPPAPAVSNPQAAWERAEAAALAADQGLNGLER